MKTWCLALPLMAAFWFTNGVSTLSGPTKTIAFEASKIDPDHYDHDSFVTGHGARTAPDCIHFYNQHQAWGNDLNDSAVAWPEIQVPIGSRVRLSFYYRFTPIVNTKLVVGLTQFGLVSPGNYNIVGYDATMKDLGRSTEWRRVEIEYTLDAKAEAITPSFEMMCSKDGVTQEKGWTGEAWIDDVKVMILP
jgi:hypothetical protein